MAWSHGAMAWSHGCFGLWRGAMAVSAISLREQIKPKRKTRLPEAHFAVHAPLYHEILWALSQIARLQLKYSLKYSLTDRWCIKCIERYLF